MHYGKIRGWKDKGHVTVNDNRVKGITLIYMSKEPRAKLQVEFRTVWNSLGDI